MPPAERLGKYELVRHLASGGMARVYLARVSGVGGFERYVVLKTVRPERIEDQSYVTMFLDEARVVATLHHQHIAQVYEIGVADDGTYFLAMEYLHGETARAVLEHARVQAMRLPLELGITVACAAAAGLHHAHERRAVDGTPLGIVHRDVSPSNVILGYDGSIKLIDFGIAKAEARATKTMTGFVKGKAGYMAPEQALGYKVDRRSDVFALGVLVYELTTQTRAFRGVTEYESVQKIVSGDLAPPSMVAPGYPPELEDVVMTALATDPDDRFQDAQAMQRALEMTAQHLSMNIGMATVTRVLGELFGARPEPWLAEAAATTGEDLTYVDVESSPMLAMPAPPKVTARGVAVGLPPVPPGAGPAAGGDELETSRFATIDPVTGEPVGEPRNTLSGMPPPLPSRAGAGSTPPPRNVVRRNGKATVPIRNTPAPRVIAPPQPGDLPPLPPLPPVPVPTAGHQSPTVPMPVGPAVTRALMGAEPVVSRAGIGAQPVVPPAGASSPTHPMVAPPHGSSHLTPPLVAPPEQAPPMPASRDSAPPQRMTPTPMAAARTTPVPNGIVPKMTTPPPIGTIPPQLPSPAPAAPPKPAETLTPRTLPARYMTSPSGTTPDGPTQPRPGPPARTQGAIGLGTGPSGVVPLLRLRSQRGVVWAATALACVVAVGLIAMVVTRGSERTFTFEPPTTTATTKAPSQSAPKPPPAPKPSTPPAASATPTLDVVMLRVTTEPTGATVVLDGVRLGESPFTTMVPRGREAVLKVRKRHHKPRKMKVLFDQDIHWDVKLPKR